MSDLREWDVRFHNEVVDALCVRHASIVERISALPVKSGETWAWLVDQKRAVERALAIAEAVSDRFEEPTPVPVSEDGQMEDVRPFTGLLDGSWVPIDPNDRAEHDGFERLSKMCWLEEAGRLKMADGLEVVPIHGEFQEWVEGVGWGLVEAEPLDGLVMRSLRFVGVKITPELGLGWRWSELFDATPEGKVDDEEFFGWVEWEALSDQRRAQWARARRAQGGHPRPVRKYDVLAFWPAVDPEQTVEQMDRLRRAYRRATPQVEEAPARVQLSRFRRG